MEVFRRHGMDKWMLYAALALILVGLVMIMSASGVYAERIYGRRLYFFLQQLAGAAVGIVLVGILLGVRRPVYKVPAVIFGLLGLTLGLLLLALVLPPVARTNRWVVLAGVRFQPSELAKISLVLYLAWFLDRKREKIREFRTLLVPMGVVLLFAFLIIREPDFGTAVLILALCLVLLFLGGVRVKHFALMSAALVPPLLVYLFSAPYRVNRLMAFFSPDASVENLNFQVAQSKLAVGSGGLFGVSFGESVQKMFFLPCSHTDFIFAIIGEEVGLLGTLLLVLAYAILVWRGVKIAMNAPDFFSQITAAGLTFFLGFQALLNITVVLGLAPAKGVPLPLVSFGRSSLFCALLAVGILLHISQRRGDGRRPA